LGDGGRTSEIGRGEKTPESDGSRTDEGGVAKRGSVVVIVGGSEKGSGEGIARNGGYVPKIEFMCGGPQRAFVVAASRAQSSE
jgi:hypothetical protein